MRPSFGEYWAWREVATRRRLGNKESAALRDRRDHPCDVVGLLAVGFIVRQRPWGQPLARGRHARVLALARDGRREGGEAATGSSGQCKAKLRALASGSSEPGMVRSGFRMKGSKTGSRGVRGDRGQALALAQIGPNLQIDSRTSPTQGCDWAATGAGGSVLGFPFACRHCKRSTNLIPAAGARFEAEGKPRGKGPGDPEPLSQ